jgi:hypothetical protein
MAFGAIVQGGIGRQRAAKGGAKRERHYTPITRRARFASRS